MSSNVINGEIIEAIQAVNGTKKNNFLCEFRPHTLNNAMKVSINEVNAKTMLSKHGESDFIAVSPCRGYSDFGINPSENGAEERLAAINNQRIREIIGLIKNSGYSYTPVYGGFIENKGTDNEQNVYERSFVIYNHDRNGNVGNMSKLIEFGLQLTKKYNQDSILVKSPGEKPKYITQNGEIDIEFDGKTTFNDMSQDYFTDLHKNTHKFKDSENRRPTRFSYVESYINPAPMGMSEAHSRHLNGEIFLPYRSM